VLKMMFDYLIDCLDGILMLVVGLTKSIAIAVCIFIVNLCVADLDLFLL